MLWIISIGGLLALLWAGSQRIGPRWAYAACGVIGLVGIFVFGAMACFVNVGFASGALPATAMDTTRTLLALSIALGIGGVIGSSAYRNAENAGRKNHF